MIFNWLQRKRHAKGFGIHSPFAFQFVTGIVYERHGYNAFSDIGKILCENQIYTRSFELHHLSYRLVRYFRPQRVLEIGSGAGINTLYITHSSRNIVCHCIESNNKEVAVAKKLLSTIDRKALFLNETDKMGSTYDGIFVYLNNDSTIDIEQLFSMSTDETFWVIAGIKSGIGKQFWQKIVKDERVKISFDKTDTGIVILKKTFNRKNYKI